MVANLREMMQAHADTVFLNTSHFAETVTYTPISGEEPKSIKAEITYLEDIESDNGNSGLEITRRRILLIETDVTRGVANPVEGDAFTMPDSVVYKLRGRPRQNGVGMQELLVLNIEIVNKGRQGARQVRR